MNLVDARIEVYQGSGSCAVLVHGRPRYALTALPRYPPLYLAHRLNTIGGAASDGYAIATLWPGAKTHANANIHADARDSYLVSCFKLVSAQAFVIYRMDPYVVVFCPSALGCRVVGLSSQGAGPGLYSCASWVRLVVLDTLADCNSGMEWIWCLA
jgi:hypothetical protein